MLLSFLLTFCCFVARGAAQYDDSAAFEAVFFYYGYLHEFAIHRGNTTIGGRGCRRRRRCTIDEFLDSTTSSQGGYRGGGHLNTDAVPGSRSTAFRSAGGLKDLGMTKKITWKPKELVIDAPGDMDIYEDHVTYVVNAIKEDMEEEDSVANYVGWAMEALRHMGEVNANEQLSAATKWYKDNGPRGLDIETVDLPVDGDEREGFTRTIIDYVNLVKAWNIEIPQQITVPQGEVIKMNLGRKWTILRISLSACYRGQGYPFPPDMPF